MNESTKLTEPGWYECRFQGKRECNWWNGTKLIDSPDGDVDLPLSWFTDFLGPLVPARRDERREPSKPWYTVDEVRYMLEHDDSFAIRQFGFADEFITKHLNLAFEKGKQIGAAAIAQNPIAHEQGEK